MTTTIRTTATKRIPMTSLRKTAFIAGALYVLTFLASIPATLILLTPVLDDPDYILGTGSATGVLLGNLLDVVTALAGIGTAVVLFPVVRRQSEAAALGFVASRLLEAAVILVGVVSLLAVVTLRQDLGAGGADAATMVAVGHALVAVHDWALLLGPGLMAAVNALLLGSLMYRSGLVPRIIPVLGLIGAPLLLGSVAATVFGVHGQFSPSAAILVMPIFVWELSLGVYLVVKGFKPSPLTAGMVAAGEPHAYQDVDA